MQYVGRAPVPPLEAFIERIWYCADAPIHAEERVLPGGGTMDLVFILVDDEVCIVDPAVPGSVARRRGAVVAGARTRCCLYDPRARASLVGVHFRPGGAFPFFAISPAELVNGNIPLDELWGSEARYLREQLIEATTPEARFRLLEAALLRRLERSRAGHPAVRATLSALAAAGEPRVAEVADRVGLSHRRFIEVFEREVGLTPKLYARLQRFHRVKRRMATLGAPESWAAFAVECGYFDQSHLIRDFVAFSGIAPEGYLRSVAGQTGFDRFVHAYSG